MQRVLVIDHRDSFVFNLVDDLARAGATVEVLRSDATLAAVERRIAEFEPDLVLLSPGPGKPEHAGVMLPLLDAREDLCFLGVCLGMQAIALAAGGGVERAPETVHGRASEVVHDGSALFEGIPSPFPAGRYHSLCIERVPDELDVIARTHDGIPMVVRHRSLPRIGVQFHPESILTPFGPRLLDNLTAALSTPSNGVLA